MEVQKLDDLEFKRFNRGLLDSYGLFEGFPKFRLVWSDDIIEKRLTKFTKDGFELLTPVVEELPKYRQWNQHRYIIEMLSFVGDNPELIADSELNYEPFYTFENKNQEFLIPHFGAAKVIIDSMLEIAGVRRPAQYNLNNDEERRNLINRVDEIEEALYGNESKVSDSLMKDSAVGYGTRMRNDSFNAEHKVSEANKKITEN